MNPMLKSSEGVRVECAFERMAVFLEDDGDLNNFFTRRVL
jgi:hypothetical protein